MIQYHRWHRALVPISDADSRLALLSTCAACWVTIYVPELLFAVFLALFGFTEYVCVSFVWYILVNTVYILYDIPSCSHVLQSTLVTRPKPLKFDFGGVLSTFNCFFCCIRIVNFPLQVWSVTLETCYLAPEQRAYMFACVCLEGGWRGGARDNLLQITHTPDRSCF